MIKKTMLNEINGWLNGISIVILVFLFLDSAV